MVLALSKRGINSGGEMRELRTHGTRSMLLIAFMAAGCRGNVEDDKGAPTAEQQPPAAVPAPATTPATTTPDSLTGIRFLVDISERKLYVLRGQDTLRSEPVAVGKPSHPTPAGEWKINRVDWNPDWTPPPGEDWTEDKEPQPPGAAKNPMGRARLVFNPPYTVHGTKENDSLGDNVSHGSIRVANSAVLQLGRLVMEAGGAPQPESFYQQVAANRTSMRQVDIPNPIPITVTK
jgi:lipoprotein-anchoring transpeptidase ErfK/SrfK